MINLDSTRLEVIYRIMNGEVFGLKQASRIVGGQSRLMRLIEEGKVRAEKRNALAQNGKWMCNAGDVLRYARIQNKVKTITIMNDIIKDFMQEDFTWKEFLKFGILWPLVVIVISIFVSQYQPYLCVRMVFCSLMQSVASGKGTAGMRQRERLVGSIPTCTTKRDLFTYC